MNTSIIKFKDTFTITNRQTGAVLLAASKEDAVALEELMSSGVNLEEGMNAALDTLAGIAADVASGDYDVIVDSPSAFTHFAIFERVAPSIALSKTFGKRDHQSAINSWHFTSTCTENPLPPVNALELGEMMTATADAIAYIEGVTAASDAIN